MDDVTVAQSPARASTADDLGAIADNLSAIAAVAGRRDLADRLLAATTRLRDPRLRIVVVGQLNQGKSQFVNALLNMAVCRVGDDETTAVPTLVQYGAQPAAELIVGDRRGHESVALPSSAIGTITSGTDFAGGKDVVRVDVSVPSALLADGLVVIDTPGVGGHGHPFAAMTLGMVSTADAVFFVSDSSQEFTAPEMNFLTQVTTLCPTVACLLTKTDLYPHWRAVADADRSHLRSAGIDIPVLPVSSHLRAHAFARQDERLNAEAGFADLYDYLRAEVLAKAVAASRDSATDDIRVVAEHLALAMSGELAALGDPAVAEQARSALVAASEQAEQMRRESARWQHTLNDGIVDLAADIDHDLRDRLRAVTREAEAAIDDSDPAKDWDRLADWLVEQTSVVIGENFVWATERAQWLGERVADHFAATGDSTLPSLGITDLDGLLDEVTALAAPDVERTGIAQKLLIGMRGSYGGVLMFGLISTMMGVALINPISVGAGLLLGSKAYRDDKQAKILERRGKAKMAVRAFTDDVSFQVGKESRDRLRTMQRVLRDHFTGVAEQAARSINESLAAAQSAAELAGTQRESRRAALEQELKSVAALRNRADQLALGSA
ncbi:dynamin family protein [Gordonia asplenii]|uniref:dynamin family protein n=1 Tax=Gordonia asplenii TaxID=2725283 RepID=UPI0035E42651